MSSNHRPLLLSRRFAPLFMVQFLIAFNGNFAKTAMLFLVAFGLVGSDDSLGIEPSLFSALAAGIFVAPFFLFSATAGQLADRADKARLIRILKVYETAVMVFAAAVLMQASVPLMLVALFLIGCQSAFFGPVKYAIIPQHVSPDEVLSATGYVEAGTFVAILLGQIVGGVAPIPAVAGAIVAVSLVGLAVSFLIPPALPLSAADTAPLAKIPFAETFRIVRSAASNTRLWRAILAISWFWGIGALATSQLIVMVEAELFASTQIATLFLTIFSVGVSAGSLLAARILNGEISARLAPMAAFGMSIGLFFLIAGTRIAVPQARALEVVDFLFTPTGALAIFGLSIMAVCGGIFVVPLYAILQTAGNAKTRSRDVAANNIMNAVAMVLAAALAAVLTSKGAKVSTIFLLVSIANLGAAAAAFAMRIGIVFSRKIERG
jgi:acyl-[acyl-carrier-protein]-phospholipid O-acyltransferase / long-chain-fatty-acid--[acyl-carrier-protein] ligase